MAFCIAEFSDRTIENHINRKFAYAWLVRTSYGEPRSGFSSRRELAEARAKTEANKIRSRMDRLKKYAESIKGEGHPHGINWANRKIERADAVRASISIEIVKVSACD